MSQPTQQIQFCASRDGTRIAYASCGKGPPLIWAAHWVGHLQMSWDSQIWRPWLTLLMSRHTLIRYDARGCGLSDHEVGDVSLDRQVEDLEAVVRARRLENFDLFGLAGGGAIAVRYAASHPEQVRRLVVHGCYARAKLVRAAKDETQREEALAQVEAIRVGWGMNNPAYRQLFTSQLIPNATAEQFREFNELIKATTSPSTAARILRTFYEADLRAFAPRVKCPTLVLHSTEDGRIPFEEGRSLAGLIPDARFVALPSPNHLPLEREPAWRRLSDEINAFLAGAVRDHKQRSPIQDDITSRESQVLDLVARGLDNAAIAAQLGIAHKTVRNHVASIFEKLGVSSRTQAVIRARDAGYGTTQDEERR